jgi:hypothetical protein
MADTLDKALFIDMRYAPIYSIQSLLKLRFNYHGDPKAWHIHKPWQYVFLEKHNPYKQVTGRGYFSELAAEKGLERVADDRKLTVDRGEFCRQPWSAFEQITDGCRRQGHSAQRAYSGEARLP